MLAKVERQVFRDLLDPKDKRDMKGRGCLEWSTSAGGAQTAVEMLGLSTQVNTSCYQNDISMAAMTDIIKAWWWLGTYAESAGRYFQYQEVSVL